MKHLFPSSLLLGSASLLLGCAALAAGCASSHAEAQPVDPVVAAAEVRAALESVAVAASPEQAREAWRLAHQRFERGLEEPLRASCGHRATLELEYGFGRLGAALAPSVHARRLAAVSRPGAEGAPSEQVRALLAALDQRLTCL